MRDRLNDSELQGLLEQAAKFYDLKKKGGVVPLGDINRFFQGTYEQIGRDKSFGVAQFAETFNPLVVMLNEALMEVDRKFSQPEQRLDFKSAVEVTEIFKRFSDECIAAGNLIRASLMDPKIVSDAQLKEVFGSVMDVNAKEVDRKTIVDGIVSNLGSGLIQQYANAFFLKKEKNAPDEYKDEAKRYFAALYTTLVNSYVGEAVRQHSRASAEGLQGVTAKEMLNRGITERGGVVRASAETAMEKFNRQVVDNVNKSKDVYIEARKSGERANLGKGVAKDWKATKPKGETKSGPDRVESTPRSNPLKKLFSRRNDNKSKSTTALVIGKTSRLADYTSEDRKDILEGMREGMVAKSEDEAPSQKTPGGTSPDTDGGETMRKIADEFQRKFVGGENNASSNNNATIGNEQSPAPDYKIVVVKVSPSVKGLVDQFEGQVTKGDGRQTVKVDDSELNLKMVTCSAWENYNMTPIRNTTNDCDGVVFVYDGSEKNLSRGILEAYAEVLNNLENKGIPVTFVAKCNLGEKPVNEMQQEASKRNMKHVEWSGNNENSVTAVLTDLTKQIRDIEKSHTNQFKF